MSLWIKFDHWTLDKPEVYHIAERLKIDPDAVIGKLLRIWVWADQNTNAGNAIGNAPSVTISLLDRLSCCDGFAEAMISANWLTRASDGLEFPNFDRHNGETAKERAMNALRQGKHRAKTKTEITRNAGCNSGVTESVTERALLSHDKSVTRVESEENKTLSSKEERVVDARPKRISKPAFAKPTLAELVEYIATRTKKIDPERFIDHYESNGWRVGKNPMKDWKATARTWEKNEFQSAGRNGSTQPDCLDAANYVGAPCMSEAEIGGVPY